jgi:uncharacterized protein YcnI
MKPVLKAFLLFVGLALVVGAAGLRYFVNSGVSAKELLGRLERRRSVMRRFVAFVALVLAMPVLAFAHVSVRPRESKPNAEERYTVRVPTEGTVATTHVILEIPAGVMVLEVLPHDGATFETAKQGDRITAITWKKEIAPKASAEFVFRARNPTSGDLVWKAHQHFSDGTTADWVGVAGEKRPASVTKLAAAVSAGAAQIADADTAGIEAWLKGYDAAFNAKDLERLAGFYHPDVTIYEGGGIKRLDGLSGPAPRSRAEGVREPAVRAQQHEGERTSWWSIGVRHVRVLYQGQDGRARNRFARPRDTRSSQRDGRQLEDSPLAYVEPSRATSSCVDLRNTERM